MSGSGVKLSLQNFLRIVNYEVREGVSKIFLFVSYESKEFNMSRATEESADTFCKRLMATLNNYSKPKGEKGKPMDRAPEYEKAEFDQQDSNYTLVDALQAFSHLWITTKTGKHRLPIVKNIPTITDFTTNTKCFIAHHPIKASILTSDNANLNDHIFWYTMGPNGEKRVEAQGPIFTPGKEHVGKELYVSFEYSEKVAAESEEDSYKFTLYPTTVIKKGVSDYPLDTWCDRRLNKFSQQALNNSSNATRISSFNLLAPAYASTPLAKEMFSYCPSGNLTADYRLPLILRELSRINSDICALQEVTQDWYQHLQTAFSHCYDGLHDIKRSNALEGIALFWKKDKYDLLLHKKIDFRLELLQNNEYANIVSHMGDVSPTFFTQVLPNLNTIFQLVALKEKATGKVLLIGNSHLFFDGGACHIRLLQTHVLLRGLRGLQREIGEMCPVDGVRGGPSCRFVVMGDMNSSPDAPPAEYLRKGMISRNDDVWKALPVYMWGRDKGGEGEEEAEGGEEEKGDEDSGKEKGGKKKEEKVGKTEHQIELEEERALVVRLVDELLGRRKRPLESEATVLDLYHDMKLKDVYEDVGCELKYTNYVKGFKNRLDWIWVDESTQVENVLDGIEEEDLRTEYTWYQNGRGGERVRGSDNPSVIGIPNSVYGSDHISIGADVVFQ